MNRNRKEVTSKNPARTIFLVLLVVAIVVNAFLFFKREYDRSYNEYLLSFRVGEYYGKLQVLVDLKLWLEEITLEEYQEYQDLNFALFEKYSKEQGQRVVDKVNSIIDGSEIVYYPNDANDMQGFQDGYMVTANEVNVAVAYSREEISEEEYEEINKRRQEICDKPEHREAERFIQEMIELNKAWLQNENGGYDERGSDATPL